MAHLLVSWIARNHDFLTNEKGGFQAVDSTGPTAQFHQHFFAANGYDEHVILYADSRQELLAEHLLAYLRHQHPGRAIRTELLPLADVIDLATIKTKVETWLLRHARHELTLYFSPGTSIMQLAWYICHTTLGLRTHLVQTRAAKFSPDKRPALMQLEVTQSTTPVTAIIRENQIAERLARAEAEARPGQLRPARRTAASQPEPATAMPGAPGFLLLPSLARVYQRAGKVAKTDKVTVLVLGESGTGKEHLARTVHEQSPRKNALFLAVNCAALTESVLESRLFGYVKGAFTGADKDTKGLFEEATGGTIFLDEIGDISPAMQATLLRVLQEGEIQPLGGKPRRVDVRVVAATHADLAERCRQGRFRWDLYYRLAVAELELPALRECPTAEREQLLDFFIDRKQRTLTHAAPLVLAQPTRQQLLAYTFPGNVRELENLVEMLYVFSEPGQVVLPADLPRRLQQAPPASQLLSLADASRAHVVRVVAQCGGVKRQAAKLLDIDERVVAKYLREATEATAQLL